MSAVDGERDLVRQQSFDSEGPAELDVSITAGRITIELAETAAVTVSVRHDDTGSASSWTHGLSGLISWLGEATAASDDAPGRDLSADAVAAVELQWSEVGRRLVVRSPSTLPLRLVPLVVTVTAPSGSRVRLDSGAGTTEVRGTAGHAEIRSGAGEVRVDTVEGDVDVTTGSGGMHLAEVSGRVRARSGSGRISLADLGGPAEVKVGSGEVRLGTVRNDLAARTGSGNLTVSDARDGLLELTTGSGQLRVSVHPGVAAELDLSTGSGQARSELEVTTNPPAQRPTLVIRGRTGTGDVVISRAVR